MHDTPNPDSEFEVANDSTSITSDHDDDHLYERVRNIYQYTHLPYLNHKGNVLQKYTKGSFL